MASDDPRIRREQSRLGRIVNRVDNMLVMAGAALTFSREQIRKAQESNRSVKRETAVQPKPAPQVQ